MQTVKIDKNVQNEGQSKYMIIINVEIGCSIFTNIRMITDKVI